MDASASTLDWLIQTLWRPDATTPPSIRVAIGSARRVPPGDLVEQFAILPNRTHPRSLVPVGSRRVASAAMRVYNDSQRPTTRLARAVIGAGMSLGIAQQGFRDRLFVTAASGVDRAALPAVSVTSYLTETLHEGALEAAVVFRRATPNRKPILQMIDPLGRTTAFVKIGWNELTRDLVRNEGAILRRFTDDPPSSFSVPALRHAGPWQDLETLAVAPLPNRFWTRQIQATLPIEATREIALGEGEDRRDLATSPFRAKLLARLDLLGGNTSRVGSAVALLNDVVRSTGVDPFRFGRWHGDWAPWNMASSNGRLYVWDWERGGGPVPLGFDAIHFAFQTAMRDLAHDASASLDKADHASASVWSSLGLDEETRLATVALYLLEIYVRYEEANVRGASADDRLPDATLRVADQVIRRLV